MARVHSPASRRDRAVLGAPSPFPFSDPFPEPATARLIGILPNGKQEILIDGSSGILSVPTGMTFGPDGALYISNIGYGAPPIGLGQVVRAEIIH